MDAKVAIFKHRHSHSSGQLVSGAGPRQYFVDEDSMCLHLLMGKRKRVAAEPGVKNAEDIAEFRAFPETFQEVSVPAPPPSAVAVSSAPDAAPVPAAESAVVPPHADEPKTIEQLLAEDVSVPKLADALSRGHADHLDFKALAAAERDGRDRKGAIRAILGRMQFLAQSTD